MQKIMFNDKYGLAKAVLEGRKTMTRRILKAPRTMEGKDVYGISVVTYHTGDVVEVMAIDKDEVSIGEILPKYKVGEIVAVAQCYEEALSSLDWVNRLLFKDEPGWKNKMFVRADLMPHQIRITNVRVERLQDISEEDCGKEGIIRKWIEAGALYYYYVPGVVKSKRDIYPSARDAFAALIDKVSGKGTWDSNPWVFVYEFELLK